MKSITASVLANNGHEVGGYLVGPYANLEATYMLGADLSNLDFSGANLRNANLTNANLTGTNFQNADLSCSEFVFRDEITYNCADLRNANLSSADFTGANVLNAIFIDTYWHQTIWTDGVAYDENQA